MTSTQPDLHSKALREHPRPWAFNLSELTAGLRRLRRDPTLQIVTLEDYDIPVKRPSIGQFRGVHATCRGESGEQDFRLVLKEPRGTTRTGTAGVGLREVAVYQILSDQLPVRIPTLIAAHPVGDWLVLNLLPPGRDPETWNAEDYLKALDRLIFLHDRFWDLGPDLSIYTWLARPLDSDFEIYITAAAKGVKALVEIPNSPLLRKDPEVAQLLGYLVLNADRVAAGLRQTPSTLIHGDYWPGNIHLDESGKLTVFDWQQTGIGPGVLDLVTFVQSSRWWFDPLPLSPEEIITYYRKNLAKATGFSWDEPAWEALWDQALLWSFIAHWIDLVAAIPHSLLETRYDQFEAVWLQPLRQAADRLHMEG